MVVVVVVVVVGGGVEGRFSFLLQSFFKITLVAVQSKDLSVVNQ